MRKYFLFFIVLIFGLFKSQYNVLIEYSYKFVGDTKAIVLASKDENVSFLTVHNKGNIKYEDVMKNYSLVNVYYIFRYKKESNKIVQSFPFFFIDSNNFENDVAIDKVEIPNWKILNEKKEILGYQCIKAVGEFRGRIWSVWFTKDIYDSIFPWKLSGLPGAILEAEDASRFFSIKAERCIENGNFEIPKQMHSFFDLSKKTAIDYKMVADRKTKELKELQNIEISKYPKGAILGEIPHYRYGELEKTFEWEVESKKP